jgi:uncharacterized protein YcfL
MKKILFLFPIIALLAAGCSSTQQASNQTVVQTPIAQNANPAPTSNKPTTTLTTQITTGWNTFTNEADGYTLKYPNKFSLEKNDKISPNNSNNLFYSATFGYPNKLGSPGTIFTDNSNLNDAKKDIEASNYKELGTESKIINGNSVTIMVIQNIRPENKQDISNVAYISHGNSFLIFSMGQVYTEDFNNILSTIQFK